MPRPAITTIALKTARATARQSGTSALAELGAAGQLRDEQHRQDCLTELRALLAGHTYWRDRQPLWALYDFCQRWPLAGDDWPG